MADSCFSSHRQITSQEEVQYFCAPELVEVEASDAINIANWASTLNFKQQSLLVIVGQLCVFSYSGEVLP